MILNCDNSWPDSFKSYLHTPSVKILYHNHRATWALVHKIRNQDLGPCLRAPKEAKERQSQIWPGINLLPDFPMKIKVALSVFTNHWLSIKINLFLQPGVPLSLNLWLLMFTSASAKANLLHKRVAASNMVEKYLKNMDHAGIVPKNTKKLNI